MTDFFDEYRASRWLDDEGFIVERAARAAVSTVKKFVTFGMLVGLTVSASAHAGPVRAPTNIAGLPAPASLYTAADRVNDEQINLRLGQLHQQLLQHVSDMDAGVEPVYDDDMLAAAEEVIRAFQRS